MDRCDTDGDEKRTRGEHTANDTSYRPSRLRTA